MRTRRRHVILRLGSARRDEAVEVPVPASQPDIVERASVAVRDRLGEATWRRIETFEHAVAGLEPNEPHHYIGMLGVRDRYRGEGLARRLVDDVAQLAIDDPDSRSVCLSTESVENLALYARLRFEVIGETRIESLQSWTLSRMESD